MRLTVQWQAFSTLFLTLLVPIQAYAQVPVGPNRPIGIPAGYVVTPSGYFHPSCVQQLAEGDTLLEDGPAIQHADGTVARIPVCEYPHYTTGGRIAIEGSAELLLPVITNTWIEDAQSTIGTSYGELTATWTVPLAPISNDNQAIAFFPGLQQASGPTTILQPSLIWVNGNWVIVSEDCCPGAGGSPVLSPPVIVNPGDKIRGLIRQACKAGTQHCKTWNVTTIPPPVRGKPTTLKSESSYGHTFNEAFAGALEIPTDAAPYSIVQCSDYPPNGQITFSNVALYDYNLTLISNPGWSIAETSGLTPQCGYTGKVVAANQVILDYLPTVKLSPYGTVQVSTTPPPYSTVVVDGDLNDLVAPADVTVTLLREVISQCSGILFKRNDTVVVSEGQTTGTFSDYAGRDPKCPNDPITTQWTVTGAVLAPSNLSLNLGMVPSQQLTLSAVF